MNHTIDFQDLLTPATATAYLQGLPAGTALKDHFSDCHCSAIGISNMSGDLKTACESYYDTQVMMLLVTTGSSLLVVAINFVMKSGLVGLANYERPLTVSGLECAISTKVPTWLCPATHIVSVPCTAPTAR